VSEDIIDIAGRMDVVIDLVTGYRAKMQTAGFNETAAEIMATQYHAYLMTVLTRSMSDSVKVQESDDA